MKILITGSSGMLGRALCEALAGKNEVVGIDVAEPTGGIRPDIFYNADATDSSALSEIFERENPEVVIHAAAMTDVDGCETDPEKAMRLNAISTEKVAVACLDRDASLVYISTDFVFDGKKGSPYTEEDATGPLSVYGRSKLEGEEAVKRMLTRYAIVRTSWLFGPGGRNFVDAIVDKAEEGEHLEVVDDQIGSPTYTKDLAQAIKRFIVTDGAFASEVFNISNSGRCSWYEFAAAAVKDAGFENIAIDHIRSKDLDRPAKRPPFSVLDCSKFEKKTGFRMRFWREALDDYLKEKGQR